MSLTEGIGDLSKDLLIFQKKGNLPLRQSAPKKTEGIGDLTKEDLLIFQEKGELHLRQATPEETKRLNTLSEAFAQYENSNPNQVNPVEFPEPVTENAEITDDIKKFFTSTTNTSSQTGGMLYHSRTPDQPIANAINLMLSEKGPTHTEILIFKELHNPLPGWSWTFIGRHFVLDVYLFTSTNTRVNRVSRFYPKFHGVTPLMLALSPLMQSINNTDRVNTDPNLGAQQITLHIEAPNEDIGPRTFYNSTIPVAVRQLNGSTTTLKDYALEGVIPNAFNCGFVPLHPLTDNYIKTQTHEAQDVTYMSCYTRGWYIFMNPMLRTGAFDALGVLAHANITYDCSMAFPFVPGTPPALLRNAWIHVGHNPGQHIPPHYPDHIRSAIEKINTWLGLDDVINGDAYTQFGDVNIHGCMNDPQRGNDLSLSPTGRMNVIEITRNKIQQMIDFINRKGRITGIRAHVNDNNLLFNGNPVPAVPDPGSLPPSCNHRMELSFLWRGSRAHFMQARNPHVHLPPPTGEVGRLARPLEDFQPGVYYREDAFMSASPDLTVAIKFAWGDFTLQDPPSPTGILYRIYPRPGCPYMTYDQQQLESPFYRWQCEFVFQRGGWLKQITAARALINPETGIAYPFPVEDLELSYDTFDLNAVARAHHSIRANDPLTFVQLTQVQNVADIPQVMADYIRDNPPPVVGGKRHHKRRRTIKKHV